MKKLISILALALSFNVVAESNKETNNILQCGALYHTYKLDIDAGLLRKAQNVLGNPSDTDLAFNLGYMRGVVDGVFTMERDTSVTKKVIASELYTVWCQEFIKQ